MCLLGITLIEIPYWWDRKYESLVASIYSQRPDLFNNPIKSQPIPLTEPNKKHKQKSEAESNIYNSQH
jgi:hypothetical protein